MFSFAADITRGYVDTTANAFLLGCVLFLLRLSQTRHLADACIAAASFGLAWSVKFNVLVMCAVMALPFIIVLIQSRLSSLTAFMFCLIACAVPVMPWLLLNYASSGYPFECVPLSIGRIHLGVAPPNLNWFLERIDLTPTTIAEEAYALFKSLQMTGDYFVSVSNESWLKQHWRTIARTLSHCTLSKDDAFHCHRTDKTDS